MIPAAFPNPPRPFLPPWCVAGHNSSQHLFTYLQGRRRFAGRASHCATMPPSAPAGWMLPAERPPRAGTPRRACDIRTTTCCAYTAFCLCTPSCAATCALSSLQLACAMPQQCRRHISRQYISRRLYVSPANLSISTYDNAPPASYVCRRSEQCFVVAVRRDWHDGATSRSVIAVGRSYRNVEQRVTTARGRRRNEG